MKKYIAYYRVSTNKQGVSGLGLAAQQKAVRDFVESRGGELIGEYTDVMSGRKEEREGFQKAIQVCQLKNAVFLAAKFDRMARSQRILLDLQESNIEIQAVDMPEANRLTIGLFAVMAEYESQVISERTKAALQAAKARGQVLGNPDLKNVRNSNVERANQVRIKRASERNALMKRVLEETRKPGHENSYRQIAEKLNNEGYRTARGGEFHANSVRRLML